MKEVKAVDAGRQARAQHTNTLTLSGLCVRNPINYLLNARLLYKMHRFRFVMLQYACRRAMYNREGEQRRGAHRQRHNNRYFPRLPQTYPELITVREWLLRPTRACLLTVSVWRSRAVCCAGRDPTAV